MADQKGKAPHHVFPLFFALDDGKWFLLNADGTYEGDPADLRKFMENETTVHGTHVNQSNYMLMWLVYRSCTSR